MAPFEQFFIEMQGTTAPCCFMGTERMGNVYQDGFETVLLSPSINRLRKNRFLPPCQSALYSRPLIEDRAHVGLPDDQSGGSGPWWGPEILSERQKHVVKQ